jgi:hypothetical protein
MHILGQISSRTAGSFLLQDATLVAPGFLPLISSFTTVIVKSSLPYPYFSMGAFTRLPHSVHEPS